MSQTSDARAEISTGQIAVTGKKGHNSLNWKEDFVHLALDQLVGATSNLDREKNP